MRVAITPRSVSRPLLVSFAARMRAQSPRLEQRSKRLRRPVRSRRKRGITGFAGTANASVIGSLSSVPMSAGTIGFRARLSLGFILLDRSEG